MENVVAVPAVTSKKSKQRSITSIERVDRRNELQPRPEPHWKHLVEGRSIGYRYATKGSAGSYIARARIDDQGKKKYAYEPLGEFSDMAEEKRYAAALALAHQWFDHLDKGGSVKATTVAEACESYIEDRRMEKGDAAAKGAAGCFRRLVFNDPIAKIELAKATPHNMAEFKKRVLAACPTKSTFNRSIVYVVAALNLALRRRQVASDHSWKVELRKFKNADGKRKLYLDRDARRQLLEAASAESKPYLTLLCLLPLRPGVPRHLKVEHLDAARGTLHIPQDKSHAPRDIAIGNGVLAHLKSCAQGKLPSMWLFAMNGSEQWSGNEFEKHVRVAVAAAGLPKAVSAYVLRHSTITDMISAGASIFSVAKIAGTSVQMIDKVYGHLQPADSMKALQSLELAA